jgi:hypothetical protein
MRNRFLFILLVFATQLQADVLWKRATVLRNDLARALELPPDQLCKELDTYSCTDMVHNFALGGRDPFERAQYTSMEKPSQLTATAFERTVLQSCIQRIKKDAGAAMVFRFYALNRTLNETSDDLIQQQIQDLYRRFYQRPASSAEVTTALKLADRSRFGSTRMDQWSQALCLAVGSQWANLFF